MVMMGQQLMDSERKQEDDDIDDYHIKPHNNHTNRTTEEQKQRNSSQDNMKKREVPTLATLAQKSHERNQPTTTGNGTENGSDGCEGDNNNKVIRQIVELVEEGSKCIQNGAAKVDEDKGNQLSNGQDHDIAPSNQTSTTAGGGETTTTSSGRTSSCDSSGVGTSLTSSSSSEPIEREEIVSPIGTSVPVASNGVVDQVPDNNCNSKGGTHLTNSSTTPKIATNILNGVAAGSASCQALLLAEDFNGQMTVAKKFLKMVRDGINDSANGSTTIASSSSRLKGGDSSTDEDTSIGTSNNKPSLILSNTISNNTNAAVNNVAVTTKEKVVGPIGGRAVVGLAKAVNTVPGIAAALNLHPVLEKGPPPSCVQEVWAHNLLEEFAKIRRIVKKYTYIAMDTEFPGIVVRPQCAVRGAGVFPYELLKVNVDRLKIIQLGVTFMDKDGKCPPGVCTWQFNFRFSLNNDLYASDSISLLTRCGIQFERHAEMGIDPEMFGEYFMSSGMVTSDQVTYLTFHSGFDFGYLIKLLSNLPLPDNEEKFFEIMKIYFPNVYDLKFLMKSVDLHGGLQDIANQMGQERVGTQHQAGSDSLLTGMTFFKLLSTDVFNGEIDEAKYCGKLYGFHMMEDGNRDDGWNDINSLLDATSPKPPPPTSRNTNSNGTTSNSLHPSSQSSQHSSSGNSLDNR